MLGYSLIATWRIRMSTCTPCTVHDTGLRPSRIPGITLILYRDLPQKAGVTRNVSHVIPCLFRSAPFPAGALSAAAEYDREPDDIPQVVPVTIVVDLIEADRVTEQ